MPARNTLATWPRQGFLAGWLACARLTGGSTQMRSCWRAPTSIASTRNVSTEPWPARAAWEFLHSSLGPGTRLLAVRRRPRRYQRLLGGCLLCTMCRADGTVNKVRWHGAALCLTLHVHYVLYPPKTLTKEAAVIFQHDGPSHVVGAMELQAHCLACPCRRLVAAGVDADLHPTVGSLTAIKDAGSCIAMPIFSCTPVHPALFSKWLGDSV
jgi:hypothetical protein